MPALATARPADDLAVVRIDDERGPDDVSVPASELEAVRAPPEVRAHDDDLAVMGEVRPLGVVTVQEKAVRLHDAVDPFMVHRRQAARPELPVQHCRDAAIAISWPGCDEGSDQRQQRRVLRLVVAPTRLGRPLQPVMKVRAGYPEHVRDGLHREPSFSGDCASHIGFFGRALSRASFRISTSSVLRPSWRSSSRMRSSS